MTALGGTAADRIGSGGFDYSGFDDEINGLPNKAVLMQAGEVLFHNAVRGHLSLSVALVRIDGFKQLVSEHGHEAGVRALNLAGSTLQARFRRSDMVGYLGGGQFCVLAVNMAGELLSDIFSECRSLVSQKRFPLAGQQLSCTISVAATAKMGDTFASTLSQVGQLLDTSGRIARNCTIIR
ncbi:MAG: GGDEF domain-containing protein [Campylobacterales bacterium]